MARMSPSVFAAYIVTVRLLTVTAIRAAVDFDKAVFHKFYLLLYYLYVLRQLAVS